MAIHLTPIEEKTLFPVMGVTLGCAKAGIKKQDRYDLMVMVFSPGTEVVGVFTQNQFCAAPVTVCRQRLSAGQPVRSLCVNTGIANAGTGQKGIDHAVMVCDELAKQLKIDQQAVLPFSTGVIMEYLLPEKIVAALPGCVAGLRRDGWGTAAQAIMTTDTMAKAASTQCVIDGQTITVTGIAKGSGMICPNMATMLGFIATDACIDRAALNHLVKDVADHSFNLITVDGDTSTNDSFIIAATNQGDHRNITDTRSADYQTLYQAVTEVALELAQAIVRDGEGATKFITIHILGAKTVEEAHKVAKSIAHSPLVKTAFFASDPNLGRILSAIGNAGLPQLDTDIITLWLNDVLVAEQGGRAAAYQEKAGQAVMDESEILVTVDLARGDAQSTCFTCDLSYDYVRINADYRS